MPSELELMPSGPFVKIYGTILTSSIWGENDATLRLWITMLCVADADGYVRGGVPGLARVANISREACRTGLDVLEAPDADDKSGVEDGRRIIRMQGGWRVVNYRAYRELRTPQQVQNAARVARHRERYRSITSVTVMPELELEEDQEPLVLFEKADAFSQAHMTMAQKQERAMISIEEDFNELWRVYPKRAGGNPKRTALRAYTARRKAGWTKEAIAEGLARYTRYVTAAGKVGTELVQQAATFFGPNECFTESWDVPAASETVHDALHRWVQSEEKPGNV